MNMSLANDIMDPDGMDTLIADMPSSRIRDLRNQIARWSLTSIRGLKERVYAD